MIRVSEWLDENKSRRYPFIGNADMTLSGGRELPNDFLLDFKCIHKTVVDYSVALVSVTVGATTVTATFTVAESSVTTAVALDAVVPYCYAGKTAAYYLTACFGEGISKIAAWGAGTYTATTPILILPTLLTTAADKVVTSVNTYSLISNKSANIKLAKGSNMEIAANAATNTIYFSAILGGGTGLSCEVLPETRKVGEYIQAINGVIPDDNGNIDLIAGNGFEIIPDKANHRVIIKLSIRDDEICE